MNRKEGVIVSILMLGTFVGGVFAEPPAQQLLNVFVTNLPQTHLGQSVSDLVVISCYPLETLVLECQRFLSDGSRVIPFKIPISSVLVVTDVKWRGLANRNFTVADFTLQLRSPTGQTSTVFDFVSPVVPPGGFQGFEHMTAGFVVSWTATMLAFSQSGDLIEILLYGYLKTGPQITPIP